MMTELSENNAVFKELDSVLKKYLSEIVRVKAGEISESRKKADKIIESLLTIMKKIEPLFESMNPESQARGSVGNQLKVVKPNEFDTDVILDLPVEKEKQNAPKHVQVIVSQKYPSWVKCRINPLTSFRWGTPRGKRRKASEGLMDKEGFLLSRGVRSLMHSLVIRSIKRAKEGEFDGKVSFKDWSKLSVTLAGPAVTIKYTENANNFTGNEEDFSIDLVAAIKVPQYCKEDILKGLRVKNKVEVTAELPEPLDIVQLREKGKQVVISMSDIAKCYLVPVEPRVRPGDPPPPNNLLRLSIPTVESNLLSKKSQLKDGIRLLKVLRDKNGWKPIASFFLVNLATGSKMESQNLEKLPLVFLKLLHLLQGHLFRQNLPLTWAPGCNLFVKLTTPFCDNVQNRISNFLEKLRGCGIAVTDFGIFPCDADGPKPDICKLFKEFLDPEWKWAKNKLAVVENGAKTDEKNGATTEGNSSEADDIGAKNDDIVKMEVTTESHPVEFKPKSKKTPNFLQ